MISFDRKQSNQYLMSSNNISYPRKLIIQTIIYASYGELCYLLLDIKTKYYK